LQTWTIANDKAYNLTYVTDLANFDTGMPLAQQMIDSFQILGQDDVTTTSMSSIEGTSINDTDSQELSTTTDLDNQSQQRQQQEPLSDTPILADADTTDTTINSTNSALGRGQASIVINLTGDGIVPPITTEATGVAEFMPEGEDSISYTVNATSIEGVMAGHIHGGANGAVVVTLFEFDDPVNEVRESGTITADKLEGPLAGKPLSELAIAKGGLYVDIHTIQNPNGEISGQSESL
jgi:hypothetical protein